MLGLINKFSDYYHTMSLKKRMLFVYLIGCVLPICVMYIYMYRSTRDVLVEQEVANENEKLETVIDELTNNIAISEELSSNFYYDKRRKKLVVRRYSELDDIYIGATDSNVLGEYLNEFYPVVDKVTIYLYEDNVDNGFFCQITDSISDKKWFQDTMNNNGLPCWSYLTDIKAGKKHIRLTRVLYDENQNRAGVLSVSLASDAVSSIEERTNVLSFLCYNHNELVLCNESLAKSNFEYIMKTITGEDFDGWLNIRNGKFFAVHQDIKARYSTDVYSVVVVKSYDDVLKLARRTSVQGLIPMLLAILIAGLAVVTLSNWMLRRITGFSKVMHDAAKGNFEVRNTSIGSVQDEIWVLNEDLNRMIADIKDLMDTAVKEKVQKEQLYSRQKDVEFKMLATQINPHFLYNTLENIRMLARINKQPEIEDISVTLTKLLRRSLNVGQNLETLMWEMEMIESYVKIQNYRFGERIRTEISYDKDLASKYMVIPLCVQPFVENAYVHAMEDKESDGLITIRVEIGDILRIYIEDNGHGMTEEQLKEITHYINDFNRLDRTHIGICNVNQRIKLKFGGSFGVDFDSVENVGTKVKITMPAVPNDKMR